MTRPIATLGIFDGCHHGHMAVAAEAVRWAKERQTTSVAFTFHPHPRTFAGVMTPALNSVEERVALLEHLGIDRVQVLPFSRELHGESAESFARRVFRDECGAAGVVLGKTAKFGHARTGNAAKLAKWSQSWNMEIRRVPPVTVAGALVSSSRARDAVGGGRMAVAAGLLGRPFAVSGVVGRGQALARRLGLPTLNIPLAPDRLSPPTGVYAGWVSWPAPEYPFTPLWLDGGGAAGAVPPAAPESGQPKDPWTFAAAADANPPDPRREIGPRREAILRVGPPMASPSQKRLLEAHAFGLEGEQYGQRAIFHFGDLLRPPIPFENENEAKRQLARDAEAARQWHEGRRGPTT